MPNSEPAAMIRPRIAAILAGGKSARFGSDKAVIDVRGERLVDRVAARLRRQADRVLISGPTDYGLGLELVPDAANALKGPAAGVFSIARHLAGGGAMGFVTAPVDGPNAPDDLVARLSDDGSCAVGAENGRWHPTFAYWSIARLLEVEAAFRHGSHALMRLAALTAARPVAWRDPRAFHNVNTQADLLTAIAMSAADNPSTD
jgi:molybdopterin-guanine dinucleotide biosynthesis protein A